MYRSRKLTAFQRWLIVVGGFVCYCLADGFTYSVGVLYSCFLGAFNLSSSSTAVLPGLLYAIPQFTAIFLCPLLETYGYSSGASWGAVLLSVSCIASAYAPNIQLLYLTFGLLSSFGLQLTYSSAIMAVTETFKDDRLFGLALGLTMCGSGVGSFAFNPFVAWLLESWTWREVLFIEGAILLNSMVSASCFHHLDAIRFPIAVKKSALGLYQTIGGERLTQSSVMVGEAHTTGAAPRSVEIPDEETAEFNNPSTSFRRLRSCLRYAMCVPSRCRFRTIGCSTTPVLAANSIEDIRGNMANEQSGCADFLTAFMVSLKQLGSRSLWKNPTYVVYIFANGLAGAAIVIPWTFIYDHGILSLSDENGNLDETNMSSVSLLPSLIGMGSLIGQVAFGLITSQLGQLRAPLCSCWLTQRNNFGEQPPSILPEGRNPFLGFLRCSWSDKSSCHLLLFMIVLLWSSLSTLLISLLPLSTLASHISAHVSFLSLPIGRAMAAACLLVGISYGGFYVLYPQILIDTLGENLWPAGLGVFLFVNGAMNLIGTTIGGRLFDTYNSYKPAFLLASLILFVSLTVVVVQQTVHFLLRRRLSAH
ncbi:Monocarboxylate transporter 14, variant 2 [Clonorchis sinensis]|uniref:Monocarboxylate transporter 14, variant 2 n=2 Tax=Clonorchis sinensis TaxID=79923 RepID=A0A8T1M830_CLOSI|nr:Monocarboxylate transporter 14, variant 2 [Clonorchis sinensis]